MGVDPAQSGGWFCSPGAPGCPIGQHPRLHLGFSHPDLLGGGFSVWVGSQRVSSIPLHADTVRLWLREHLLSSVCSSRWVSLQGVGSTLVHSPRGAESSGETCHMATNHHVGKNIMSSSPKAYYAARKKTQLRQVATSMNLLHPLLSYRSRHRRDILHVAMYTGSKPGGFLSPVVWEGQGLLGH